MLPLAFLFLDEVKDLVDKLRSTNDLSARYQLEMRLGRAAKPAHVPLFLKEIETGPEEIRPHLVRAIRSVGGREAKSSLKAILGRYDWGCRGEVAVALKSLDDDSGIKWLVAEFSKPTMKREDRLRVVQYLFSWYAEGKETAAALRKVLESDADSALRSRIIDALVSHRDFESIPLLRKIAGESADPPRTEARAALVKLGDASALEEILSDLETGKISATSLYRVLEALRASANARVVDRLRSVLENSSETATRVQIVRILSLLRDTKSLPIFHRLAAGSDTSLATAALEGILELAGRSEIDKLKKLLSHSSPDIRLKAAEILLALDDLAGMEVVRAELANSNSLWRRRAVTALLSVRRRESVELYFVAMADADLQVRTSAAHGLVAALSALFPYRKFDLLRMGYDPSSEDSVLREKSIERLRAWWTDHAPK